MNQDQNIENTQAPIEDPVDKTNSQNQIPIKIQNLVPYESPDVYTNTTAKSKKLLPLGLIFIAFLIFSSLIYFLYQIVIEKIKPADTVVYQNPPIIDPTEDWRVFTNPEYGYSLKYPPTISPSSFRHDMVIFGRSENSDIALIISVHTEQKTYEDLYDKYKTLYTKEYPSPSRQIREINIDKYTAFQQISETDENKNITTIFKKDEKHFVIAYGQKRNGDDPNSLIHDQILSTFEFIE